MECFVLDLVEKVQLALWISKTWTTQWSQANAKAQTTLQRDAALHWSSCFALWRIKWTTSRATAPTSSSVMSTSTASTLPASSPPSARRAIRASTVKTSSFPATPKVRLPHLPSLICSCFLLPFHCCFSSFDWGMWFLVHASSSSGKINIMDLYIVFFIHLSIYVWVNYLQNGSFMFGVMILNVSIVCWICKLEK